MVNLYGPTETTVCASLGDYTGGTMTIGRPMANVRLYILDAHGEPVPAGAAGEIYIGGVGVAGDGDDSPLNITPAMTYPTYTALWRALCSRGEPLPARRVA